MVCCAVLQLVETLLKVCPDEASELFTPVFASILKAFIEQVVGIRVHCSCLVIL